MNHLFFYYLFVIFNLGVYAQDTQITKGTVNFTFVEKDVSGTLSNFSSTSVIDWENLENSTIEGQVAAETLSTGNFLRDFTLKRSKYFDVENHPLITFKSTEIEVDSESITVYGVLSLKGISKSITIVFQKEGNSLTGTTTLFTNDFDITILKKSRAANKVVVTFKLLLA